MNGISAVYYCFLLTVEMEFCFEHPQRRVALTQIRNFFRPGVAVVLVNGSGWESKLFKMWFLN